MGKHPTTAMATALALLCVVVVLLASSCNPSALGAVFGGAVTPWCCASQQPCLCQYKRDPAYRGYVNGPVAQSVTRACD